MMIKFKQKLSKKEWNLLLICTIIVSALIIDISIRNVHIIFGSLRREIKLDEARLGRLSIIAKQREQIERDYERFVSGLQQVKSSDDFIQAIENTAESVGLSITDIKPIATKVEDSYKIYSLKIDAKDEVSTLAKFLHIISEEYKGIGIERLQINARNKRELPELNLLISAVAFKE